MRFYLYLADIIVLLSRVKETISNFTKMFFEKIFKHIFYIGIIIVVSIILTLYYPENINPIVNMSGWIITGYIVILYLLFISNFNDKREIARLKNRLNKNTEKSLFEWLGNISFHDVTIYSWLKDESNNDIIDNLKKIKKKICEEVGDHPSDYLLLKTYLEYHGKNNFMNSVWKTVIVIFTGSLGGILLKFGIIDSLNILVTNRVEETATIILPNTLEILEKIVRIGVWIIIFFGMALYSKSEFTKEKRRIDLLINIVDIIIKEKKEKGKD